MYLFNLSFGYFFYGYTTTLFLSHQRNDVISLISLMVFVLQYIVQFLVLIYTRNYMLYILVFAIAVIPQNFLYMKVSKRMYPNITCVGDISKELKHSIKIEVTSLLGHRIGAVILVSIDSAIISAFLGLSELGKYGNYYYIYSSIISLTSIISQSMLAGIGSKIITDKSNIYNLFNKLNFAWIYLVTVCACCLSGLLNPFITLIIGGNYTYSSKVVLVMVIYYFSWQFRNMGLLFKDASGLWSKDWYKPYIGMIVNLAFSVIFIMIFKSVISVLIPTIIVFLFIYYPIETRIIHRYLFNLSPMEFVVSNNKIIIVSILSIIINHYLCNYYIVQVNIKTWSFLCPFPSSRNRLLLLVT